MTEENNSRRDFLLAGIAAATLAAGCTPKQSPFEAGLTDK
jgi:hypothetical protein